MAVLAVAAAIVALRHEDEERAPLPPGPFVGAIDPAAPDAALDGGWRRHDWGSAAYGEARPADPNGRDAVYDPQRAASRRAFQVEDGGVQPPFASIERRVRIVAHEGTLPVDADAACELRVLPVQAPPFDCVVRVLCAGVVLYPNEAQTTGYLMCWEEDGEVTGARDAMASDGDPELRLDLSAGDIEVRDAARGYGATLRVMASEAQGSAQQRNPVE